MIGIGKWNASIKTKFFSGGGIFEIFDDNGKYGFRLCEADLIKDEFVIKDVKENGNTLIITISIPSVPLGNNIVMHITFDGDIFTGYASVPLLGRIEISDGKRVQ